MSWSLSQGVDHPRLCVGVSSQTDRGAAASDRFVYTAAALRIQTHGGAHPTDLIHTHLIHPLSTTNIPLK